MLTTIKSLSNRFLLWLGQIGANSLLLLRGLFSFSSVKAAVMSAFTWAKILLLFMCWAVIKAIQCLLVGLLKIVSWPLDGLKNRILLLMSNE